MSPVSGDVVFYLNQSNLIEGITEIDYNIPYFQQEDKGHYGAFVVSQKSARNKEVVTAKMIRIWQGLLGKEQQEFSGDHIENEEIGHYRSPSLPKNVRIGCNIPPSYEHVGLHMTNYLEDLNLALKENASRCKSDNEAFAKLVGEQFLRFERIHPFADGNGRTGRLLANYIATYCGRNTITFRGDMIQRNRYLKAHDSEEAMIQYIKERITDEPKTSSEK